MKTEVQEKKKSIRDLGTHCYVSESRVRGRSGRNGDRGTVDTSSLCSRPALLPPLPTFTDRTVVSSPAWVTAAKPGVREEGSVARTLVQARGPGCLAVGASPSHRAVALASHADTPARTCGVHAVHCDTKEREHR